MKTAVRIVLSLTLIVGLSAIVVAQVPGTTPNLAAPGNSPNAPNLQITSPANGQKIGVNFVNIRYQVTNPAAAVNNLPTFQVQLDGGDPVRTSSTDHTFTGLRPGAHAVIVELVDANGTPVAGTRSEVRFVVAPAVKAPGAGGPVSQRPPILMNASWQQSTETPVPNDGSNPAAQSSPEAQNTNQDQNLPSTGSALPILSVIGFGVLVGGIASALKTR